MGFAVAGVVIAAIGVAVATASAVDQAQRQEAAAKFNKKVADNQATAARQAAEANAQLRKDQLRRTLASQRAAIGGSGIQDTSGSPLLVQIDSAKQAALEEAKIRAGGEQTALGFESQGAYARFAGKQAATGSYYQAGASLLSGAWTVATNYARTQPKSGA
jgi:hypothetical protein